MENIEELFTRTISAYLANSVPEYALFKAYELPDAETLDKVEDSLELIGFSDRKDHRFEQDASSFNKIIEDISMVKLDVKKKVG